MKLFVVGANHHTTPLEWREKLAIAPADLPGLRERFAGLPGMRELLVLNTCNRVELYGVAETETAIDSLAVAYCESQGITAADFAGIRHEALDAEAVRHLVTVASGLDSQMLGENEIFGQVKEAYAAAQAAGTAGPVLNRVFQKAFQSAKYVRTHTAINEGQVSTANVAVELALTIFGDLRNARVLAVGAGEIGEKTIRAFQSRGAHHLTVSSRTLNRAMELASQLGANALPFEHLAAQLSEYDIIAAATSAPGAVITVDMVRQAMRARPAAPLFLIDLALPRDIDPTAAGLDNVYLYNLDDLAMIAEENRLARVAEVEKAEAIIAERTATVWHGLTARGLG